MYRVWVQTKPWCQQSFTVNEVALDAFLERQRRNGKRICKIEYIGR